MTRVRKTKTTVRVADGQTIFLAGLISEETSVGVVKFPILGDIPLLGKLFQHKADKTMKKNLILEITPKILWDSTSIEARQSDASGGITPAAPTPTPVQTNELEPIEMTSPPADKKK